MPSISLSCAMNLSYAGGTSTSAEFLSLLLVSGNASEATEENIAACFSKTLTKYMTMIYFRRVNLTFLPEFTRLSIYIMKTFYEGHPISNANISVTLK